MRIMPRLRKLMRRNETRFILFFIACIWLAAYAKTGRDAQIALAAGETVTNNTARLVEQNIAHTVGELDKALLYLRARMEHEKGNFSLVETASRWELMTRLTVQMAYIGADGMMKETTVRPAPTESVDLSDREHFKAHLNAHDDKLFISRPMIGRASKRWSVQLSRRIMLPGGVFGGVFVVSLDPHALADFYKSIELGPDSLVALVGHDGAIRATSNERALALGEKLMELHALRAAKTDTTPQEPCLTNLSGIDRLIGVRDVAGLPLTVIVGKSLKEVYRGYYEDLFWTITIASLLTILLGAAAVLHDVRQRALRFSNLQLHRRQLREKRTRELERANASINELNLELASSILKLKQAQEEIIRQGKLAQLGQLTATVAHEIRNPLSAVRTAAYLVERKVKEKGVDLSNELGRINGGIKRCDKIITELLDFARSRSPLLKTVTIDEWVRATVEEERKSLPPVVEVSYDLALGEGKTDFDPDRMRRVIINLLSNAAEAMVGNGKGKGRAEFVTRDPKVVVSTRIVSNNVEITVTDNGPGISEENLAKILEPLFTTKSFGAGLGLPAVEQILNLHGGGLRVRSKVGEGAAMTAWFPLVQAQIQAA
jgi:signal transduction histidine kinase